MTANNFTSYPFARNVAHGFASGTFHPVVFSPVTGRSHRMNCLRNSPRSYVCTGGNNAFVRLGY